MLARWGRYAARHHWYVVAGWLVLLAGVWAIGIGLGAESNNNFTLPGAPSQKALNLLEKQFPVAAGTSATVVYHTTNGANLKTDASLQQTLQANVAELAKLPDVASVVGPYQNAALISSDGTTALANVLYSKPFQDLPNNGVDAFNSLEDTVAKSRSANLQVELGGSLPGSQPINVKRALVFYGLLAALIVLAVALATWWSFAWPVVSALVGVGLGIALVRILENFTDVPTISETTAVMIGLGVGIDYGLFVMGRSKDYIDQGEEPADAAGHALGTIGHAVLTAGATVIVALVALLVFSVPSVTAMAYAVVLVVGSVILSALTVQPAVVGAIGERISSSRVPWARDRTGPDAPRSIWQGWADFVTRAAPVMFALAMIVLLVLAIPVFKGDLRLGPLDNSLFPTDSTQYRAWDLQTKAFGAGSTDPFLIVAEIPTGDTAAQAQLTTLVQDVQKTKGVAAVTPPQLNQTKSTAVFQVIPSTDAQASATADLVSRLRDDTLPQATKGTDLTALVTGRNAVFVDLDNRIADRLPLFIGLVVLVALVILGSVFRSVAIPIKAAIFNVLTILATYGVLVAFLTFGWGRGAVGIPHDIPVLSLLAPVFFAVLFGLSNDYEVYLVSRMREEREHGADATDAVRRGVGTGGHIVVAAALIMVFVFASYMFQPGAAVKQFGFGMTVAILLDAFVTRMTALPALMKMGGDRMWWPGIRRQLHAVPESASHEPAKTG
jgi:RND superfamily putative drug exporter